MTAPTDYYALRLEWNLVYCALIIITAIAIGIRLWVRHQLRRGWSWSDTLLCFSWLGYLTCNILYMIVRINFNLVPETMDEHADEPNFGIAKMILFHYVTVFWIFVFVVKGSMLLFFNEFISKTFYKTWIAVRVTGVLVAIGGISTFVYQMTWCLPLDRQNAAGPAFCWWDLDARFRFTLYRQAWHVVLDLIIICLPLSLIPVLKTTPTRQKIGLVGMFSLGLFCVISAILFTMGVMNWDYANMYKHEYQWFLQYEPVVEMAAALVIQCVPSFRYLGIIWRGKRRLNSESSGNGLIVGQVAGGCGNVATLKTWKSSGAGTQLDTEKGLDEKDLEIGGGGLVTVNECR